MVAFAINEVYSIDQLDQSIPELEWNFAVLQTI